ncbi:MAG: hypothetical protein NZM31_10660 [Gemmatales bacterium]|nr:hypothetical protein [Gemmatales bacterium]MDW8387457.1 biotin/lipoyl-containing protein [Gemmatales bacterium]
MTMRIEVRVPDLGLEPDTPIRVTHWYATVREPVLAGDRLVELLVPGAVYEVPCPADGTLDEVLVRPTSRVVPGQLLGIVSVAEAASVSSPDSGSTP